VADPSAPTTMVSNTLDSILRAGDRGQRPGGAVSGGSCLSGVSRAGSADVTSTAL
jgi:hypothetical protein